MVVTLGHLDFNSFGPNWAKGRQEIAESNDVGKFAYLGGKVQ